MKALQELPEEQQKWIRRQLDRAPAMSPHQRAELQELFADAEDEAGA